MINSKQRFDVCVVRSNVDTLIICAGLIAWAIIILYCIFTNSDYAIYAIERENDIAYELWGARLNKQAFGELMWLMNISYCVSEIAVLQSGVEAGSVVLTKELVDHHFVTQHNIMMDAVVQLGQHFKIYYLADLIEEYMNKYNTLADWLYKKCAEQGIPVDVSQHRRYFKFTPRKF